MNELTIRNASTRRFKRPVDIAINDGKISRIAEHLEGKGTTELDASGRLVSCKQQHT
jgi:dihydroorotase-like cyclic amidohydrolase